MKNRFLLGIFATIVGIFTLTSCDKDEYLKAEPQPYFFKIVDKSHINLYDQYDILYEEGREAEFKISPQFTINRWSTQALAPIDGEQLNQEIDPIDVRRSDGSFIVEVKFNLFENRLKISGLNIEGTDAQGEKFYVFCLDEVYLQGEIEIEEERASPFLQEGKIHYKLVKVSRKDSLVLAEADQEFIIFDDPDDLGF
ncbi:MAG: hypothetical protein J6N49_05885 [Alphaproteobacteria bacterium]|nr:hypothetical protein [Alphaproteobacteria bacterium]